MRGIVVTVDHTPQSRGAYADLRICTGNRTYSRYGALLCTPWLATAQDERQRWSPSLQFFHGKGHSSCRGHPDLAISRHVAEGNRGFHGGAPQGPPHKRAQG